METDVKNADQNGLALLGLPGKCFSVDESSHASGPRVSHVVRPKAMGRNVACHGESWSSPAISTTLSGDDAARALSVSPGEPTQKYITAKRTLKTS